MTKFKMDELDAGDGVPLNGDNPNDVLEKDNLLEVGLSKELAAGLDGKTIGEFQDVITNAIESGADINLEMFEFAKALFVDQSPETGYENNEANAVLTGFESKLQDNYDQTMQSLKFDLVDFEIQDVGNAPLPTELQPEAPGSGYFGTQTPTDLAMKELGL